MSAYLPLLMIIGAWLIPQFTVGQIPTVCTNYLSLKTLRCCPTTVDGVCGANANRGQCVKVGKKHSRSAKNVRENWPHYFTHVCQCNGNYYGYDCSRCKFGYYGPDCSQSQLLPRRPVASYTDQDWQEFIDIIQLLRTRDSGYTAILEESIPGKTKLKMSSLTFYNLYVWIHHYAAKDTIASGEISVMNIPPADYAHFGPSFNTWHRYYSLWLEWEIQYILKSEGHPDYHSFRLPYWDWRAEIQISTGIPAEELFTESKLGATHNVGGFPIVVGDIVGPNGWDTLCYRVYSQICDPNNSTGALRRCPFTGNNPCSSDNPDWPTIQQVNDVIAINIYDDSPYSLLTRTGYRASIDFDIHDDLEQCRDDRMCMCLPFGGSECDLTDVAKPLRSTVAAFKSRLHTDGHVILGLGDFNSNTNPLKAGQMSDPVASPNDPAFIVHHTMVDCIFDEWLKKHNGTQYPDVKDNFSTGGHQADGYMIPFFPLVTNGDMFEQARMFGYFCDLPHITPSTNADNGGIP